MGRWDNLSIFKKIILVIVTIFLIVNFTIGFKFAVNVEQNRLRNVCSKKLQIDKEDIEYVKITKKEVIIELISYIKEPVSTKDRTIYNEFEAKYIVDLKDSFLNREITIK